MGEVTQASSDILKWYGSVTPREKPENFQKVRDEFENSVAQEVASEVPPNDSAEEISPDLKEGQK